MENPNFENSEDQEGCADFNSEDLVKPFIAPPPELFFELKKAKGDISKITAVVKKDPSVSINLLKIINSPFYGMRQKIASVEQAAMMLGPSTVFSIAQSMMLRASTEKQDDQMVGFWAGCEDVGNTCAAIAKELKFESIDEFYTLGFFHNCGIAMLSQKFNNVLEVVREGYKFEQGTILTAENKIYKTNHTAVGYFMGKSWLLPKTTCDLIKWHHDPNYLKNGIGELTDQLYILKMAEHIACIHVTLGHQAVDHEWDQIKQTIWEHLGLSEPDYDDLEDIVKAQLAGTDCSS